MTRWVSGLVLSLESPIADALRTTQQPTWRRRKQAGQPAAVAPPRTQHQQHLMRRWQGPAVEQEHLFSSCL